MAKITIDTAALVAAQLTSAHIATGDLTGYSGSRDVAGNIRQLYASYFEFVVNKPHSGGGGDNDS